METVISTKNLSKIYNDKKCVDNLNLQIKKGEIYGFLGPNGAGKTTTMKMLLNLTPASSGEIKIFGKDLDKHKFEILEKTGNIIENPSYYGHLTGLENLRILETLLNLPKGSAEKVLSIVSLDESKDKKVSSYSLGMKQRLGVGMALIRNPQLLILDEPTNGLDPAGTKEIRDLIKHLAHNLGITVLISSHLLSEIEKISDRVGIINNGKLIYQGSIKDLEKFKETKTILKVSNTKQTLKLLYKLKPKLKDGKIVINNLNNENRAKVVRFLIRNNVDLFLLKEEQSSLEEIFLNLTESKK